MISKNELLARLAGLPFGNYGVYINSSRNLHTTLETRYYVEIGPDTREYSDTCSKCGGTMCGDGYNMARHCEFVDLPQDAEADSGPWLCDHEPDTKCTNTEFMMRIMEYSECGVIMQAFIMERMRTACDSILDNQEEVIKRMDKTLVSPDLWIACAKEFKRKYEETFLQNK